MNLLTVARHRRRGADRRPVSVFARCPPRRPHRGGLPGVFGIRPEHVEIADSGGLKLEIDVVEELGSEAFVFGRTTVNGRTESLVARVDWRNPPEKGQVVHVRVDEAHAHIFATDAAGERLVR